MIEVLFYNTLLFRGQVQVKKFPESRFNSLTKKAFEHSCLVIPKIKLKNIFIDHTRLMIKELPFLSMVCNKKDRISLFINQKGKFDVVKNYMHKIQWYDLTVSYMLSKEDDFTYLLNVLRKQRKLHYLTLWIDNEKFMICFRRVLRKIFVACSFKLFVVQGKGEKAWFEAWKIKNPNYYKFVAWRCKLTVMSGDRESYDQKIEVRSL